MAIHKEMQLSTIPVGKDCILKVATPILEEDEIDLGTLNEPYAIIPEGNYEVVFVRAHKISMSKGQRLVTHWQITQLGSEYNGIRLILSFAYPKNGKKKWGYLSKFAHCYRVAAGRKEHDRLDRLSTAIFKGKVFLGRVRTVTHDRHQVARSKAEHYSVIETLIEKLTD